MMCIKTPILLLYKNQHGICEFRYFPQTIRIVGVVSDTEMYIFRREHMETKLNFLHNEIPSKGISESKKKMDSKISPNGVS